MISKIKIIFMGTPEFGAVILNTLIKNNYTPAAVVTAPDKPVGSYAYRQAEKQILTSSPVKVLAQEYNIPVLQPENIKENLNFKSEILNLKPDLFVVAAYGLILPKEILDIPKFGSLNIHPSLLPKYRGASPIQATILNGEKETGVTIILMDEKIDHGPIVAQRRLEFPISDFQFPKLNEELSKELAELGAKLLIETLPKWLSGEIKPIPQDHTKATFTKIIKKEDGKIDWKKSAEEIERMVRAYHPWPSAYTKIKNKILKIIKADVLKINHNKLPGTIFLIKEARPLKSEIRGQASYLAVACGYDALILKEVQLEGKRSMTAKDFLNGYPWIIGTTLN